MQHEFYQKKIFEKRWYKFTDDGLHIGYKRFLKIHEYEMKYDDMGSKIIQSRRGIRGWLIPSIVLTLISLVLFLDRLSGGDVEKGAELLYLSIAIVCGTGYFLTFKNSCYLVKSNHTNAIEFLNKKPDAEQLKNFIDEILTRRKQFLLHRYGELNRNLSYEPQYNNLNWLLHNDVLNQDEFTKKVAELDRLLPSTTTIKGFTFSNN